MAGYVFRYVRLVKATIIMAQLLMHAGIQAQLPYRLEMRVVQPEVVLAQPFEMELVITNGQPGQQPAIGDTLGPFDVLQKMPPQTLQDKTRFTYLLSAYQTGRLRIPPVALEGLPAIVSGYVEIDVQLPEKAEMLQYAPPKEIRINRGEISPWWWLLLALLLAAMVWGAWKVSRYMQADRRLQDGKQNQPRMADDLLRQLKTDWENQKIQGHQLAEGLVQCLHLAWKLPKKMTSRELLHFARQNISNIPEPMLRQLLHTCDGNRFGKLPISVPDGHALLNQLQEIIENPIKPSLK